MTERDMHAGSVLVVDDMPNWCETLKELFQGEGYEVDYTTKLSRAQELVRQREFDLVVLDERLSDQPPLNQGIQLLRHIRRIGRQAEVIILTAYPDRNSVRLALKDLDAIDYLDKNPDGGFTAVTLPLLRESARKAILRSQSKRRPPRLSQDRILIVEDEERWAALLCQALSSQGYHIEVAQGLADSETMLTRAEKDDTPPYRLAIIDLQLEQDTSPDFQGTILFSMLERRSPTTDVIIVTAYPSPSRVRRAFKEYGVRDFFSKDDFDPGSFLDAVRESFDEERLRYVIARLDDSVRKRRLQIGQDYALWITCQKISSPADGSVPIWLPSSSHPTRLRVVTYAQDMDVGPVRSQYLDVEPDAIEAQPIRFTLRPRTQGIKQVTVDFYDHVRLIAVIELSQYTVLASTEELEGSLYA